MNKTTMQNKPVKMLLKSIYHFADVSKLIKKPKKTMKTNLQQGVCPFATRIFLVFPCKNKKNHYLCEKIRKISKISKIIKLTL
jgi:hypothetical protein